MKEECLGIASVPVQKWGAVYPDAQALKTGTIFEELNKPFYVTETISSTMEGEAGGVKGFKNLSLKDQKNREQEVLLQKIYENGFVLDDLILYLDTHQTDQEAVKMYREKNKERMALKKEFTEKFYPLTRDCMTASDKTEYVFCWQEGPNPWEGGCA
ncbi:spore coat protein CotJB [Lachnospiraceae bacterium 62-35]